MKKLLKPKDLIILKELIEDGRKSASKISKKVDLGREIVNYRIKRLIKENLIIKFVPKINQENYNYSEHIIFLKLNLQDEISKEKFIKEKIGDKYLLWIVKNNSGWDVMIRIYVHNFEDFKNKLNDILINFNDFLTNYYTIICSEEIKEEEKNTAFNKIYKKEQKTQIEEIKNSEFITKTDIDEKDICIIEMLQEDARLKYKEIADKLELSSDSIKYRIDKLIQKNILQGFYPIINFNKIGFLQQAYILKLNNLDLQTTNNIKTLLQKSKQVVKAVKSLSTSEYFFTVIFETPNHKKEFEQKLTKTFSNQIDILESFDIE